MIDDDVCFVFIIPLLFRLYVNAAVHVQDKTSSYLHKVAVVFHTKRVKVGYFCAQNLWFLSHVGRNARFFYL